MLPRVQERIPDDPTENPKTPLGRFRSKTTRQRIHPTESLLLWVISAHLVFLSWALGGVRLWAQIPSLGFAILGMAVALWPRNYTGEQANGVGFRLFTWPKLLKFPIFWIGLALLGYIVVQTLNPAWSYDTGSNAWWLRAVPHITWLPHGVEAPFAQWNGWRSLIVYTSGWLTVCSVWIGFTRRRTLQLLLIVLAANGGALTAVGVAQKLVPGLPEWLRYPGDAWKIGAEWFSMFIYKNHAAAYLNLTLAVTGGLAAWYFIRGERRFEKSNPAGIFAFLAVVIGIGILISRSRGAVVIMGVFAVIGMAAFFYHELSSAGRSSRPWVLLALALIFGLFIRLGLVALDSRGALDRFTGMKNFDSVAGDRLMASRAALDMLKAEGRWGSGAGSFRHLFPKYQQNYPKIYRNPQGIRYVWQHAHNDLLQFPIELGIAGTLLLLSGALWFSINLIRAYFWGNALSVSVMLGLLGTLVHAGVDFVFQNPAVLITWCTLWVVITLWTGFEEQRAQG